MLRQLDELLRAYLARDPAARSRLEVLLLYPGVMAVIYHRLAHWLYRHQMKFFARAVSQWSRFLTGIEIHPGAKVGKRLVIDHGSGIVIGETAEIGDDVLLYQGCTLGGTGKERGKRHPTIGNHVMIGCGAKVLGGITIGDHARVAAGAVVLRDVPAESTAVGVPARIARIAGKKPAAELDQIHVEDPVQAELEALREKLNLIEKNLEEKENHHVSL